METLSDWLEQQLQVSEMSISDLARKAGVKPASLSRVLAGTRKAGPEMCRSIAYAFNVPPEKIFRLAGLLPYVEEETASLNELLFVAQQLSDADLDRLLAIARTFHDQDERKKDKQPRLANA